MAVITYTPVSAGTDAGVVLSAAQTGTGDSTNQMDRGILGGAALVEIVTTIGATPTITFTFQGSPDGVTFFAVPYAVSSTPTTVTVAGVTITTATTNWYILQPNAAWRFLKLNISANTNVTLTATAWSR